MCGGTVFWSSFLKCTTQIFWIGNDSTVIKTSVFEVAGALLWEEIFTQFSINLFCLHTHTALFIKERHLYLLEFAQFHFAPLSAAHPTTFI